MKYVKAVDFQKDYLLVRYTDDEDPAWAVGREVAIDWRKDSKVQRLAHVAYHLFYLFVADPNAVTKNDEVLQEWIGRLLDERPEEGHDLP